MERGQATRILWKNVANCLDESASSNTRLSTRLCATGLFATQLDVLFQKVRSCEFRVELTTASMHWTQTLEQLTQVLLHCFRWASVTIKHKKKHQTIRIGTGSVLRPALLFPTKLNENRGCATCVCGLAAARWLVKISQYTTTKNKCGYLHCRKVVFVVGWDARNQARDDRKIHNTTFQQCARQNFQDVKIHDVRDATACQVERMPRDESSNRMSFVR